MMTATDFAALLRRLNACEDARRWAAGKGLATAWTECQRGDWLLWLAARVEIDRRLLVLAACDCARTALPLVAEGEDRPRIAIETAEAWARGEATTEEVQTAARAAAAADAADAAADAAAAAVAYAADARAADASRAHSAGRGRARIPRSVIEAAAAALAAQGQQMGVLP